MAPVRYQIRSAGRTMRGRPRHRQERLDLGRAPVASSSESVEDLAQGPRALGNVAGYAHDGTIAARQGVAARTGLDVVVRRRPDGQGHRLATVGAGPPYRAQDPWPSRCGPARVLTAQPLRQLRLLRQLNGRAVQWQPRSARSPRGVTPPRARSMGAEAKRGGGRWMDRDRHRVNAPGRSMVARAMVA